MRSIFRWYGVVASLGLELMVTEIARKAQELQRLLKKHLDTTRCRV
jgi:hypothetical protein